MYVPNFFSFALLFHVLSFLSLSDTFFFMLSAFIPADSTQSHQWRGVLNIMLSSRIFLCQAQRICGGICRCGGRQKNICKIKGLNYCTEFSKFHMALRHIIVLPQNKEALSFKG